MPFRFKLFQDPRGLKTKCWWKWKSIPLLWRTNAIFSFSWLDRCPNLTQMPHFPCHILVLVSSAQKHLKCRETHLSTSEDIFLWHNTLDQPRSLDIDTNGVGPLLFLDESVSSFHHLIYHLYWYKINDQATINFHWGWHWSYYWSRDCHFYSNIKVIGVDNHMLFICLSSFIEVFVSLVGTKQLL